MRRFGDMQLDIKGLYNMLLNIKCKIVSSRQTLYHYKMIEILKKQKRITLMGNRQKLQIYIEIESLLNLLQIV